jgi:nitrogen fixation NifU-like protein
MSELYREYILDHARNPRYAGILDPCDINHEEFNSLCGDYLHLTMRLNQKNEIIDIAWEGEGCIISQASASILSDHILNKPIAEVQTITSEDLINLLKIPITPNRLKCATLALKAIQTGVTNSESHTDHE